MKTVSKSLLLTLFVMLVSLHIYAVFLSLYWTEPFFDIFMHALGGLVAGLISLILAARVYGDGVSRGRALVWIILGSLILGILWEYYEYNLGMTFTTARNFVSDTTSDIGLDFVGGALAYFLSLKKNG